MRSVVRLLLAGLLVSLASSLASCGAVAYRWAWSDFAPTYDDSGMVGKWEGTWSSEMNGHSGDLCCMIDIAGEDAYRARFYSTYGLFFFFRHEATFRVTSTEDGVARFEGSEDLGSFAGGVYTYDGEVEGDRFEARFEAENGDHGTFSMARVVEEPEDPEEIER